MLDSKPVSLGGIHNGGFRAYSHTVTIMSEPSESFPLRARATQVILDTVLSILAVGASTGSSSHKYETKNTLS